MSRLVKKFSEKGKNLYYIDTATGMFNTQGEPDPADYQDDGIHLNDKGDIKWAKLLAPTLQSVYSADAGTTRSAAAPK